MLKKTLVVLLTVALLGILPVLAGCEKNEVKTHSESTETTSETHTVVE
jgi:hypothetical protein